MIDLSSTQFAGSIASSAPEVNPTSPVAPLPQPDNTGPTSSKQQGPPQRFDLNSIGSLIPGSISTVTGAVPSVMSDVGMAPARSQELPLSALDQVGKSIFGVPIFKDIIEPTIGNIPVLGQAIGGLGDILQKAQSSGAAVINGHQLDLYRQTASLPDSAPMPHAIGVLGFDPFQFKTVGDFRSDLAARGFTPQDLSNVATGRNGVYDYGDHATSTNPLADMATRLALDPTNLLLLTPAAGAKAAGLLRGLSMAPEGIGLEKAAVDAGELAAKVPDAVTSGAAIGQGNYAQATLKGFGEFLGRTARAARVPALVGGAPGEGAIGALGRAASTYRAASMAGYVGLSAGDVASGWAANALPVGSPLQGWTQTFHDISDAILNDHPLSDIPAFAVVAAAYTPLQDYAKAAGLASVKLTGKLMGGDLEPRLAQMAGYGRSPQGVAKFRAEFPGLTQIVHDHNLLDIARDRVTGLQKGAAAMVPGADGAFVLPSSSSAPEFAIRSMQTVQMLTRTAQHLLDQRLVSSDDIINKLYRWGDDMAGMAHSAIDANYTDRQLIEAFARWKLPQQSVSDFQKATGLTVALKLADHPTTDQLDNLQTMFEATKKGGRVQGPPLGTTHVPVDVARKIANDLGVADRPWWSDLNSKEPTSAVLSRRLNELHAGIDAGTEPNAALTHEQVNAAQHAAEAARYPQREVHPATDPMVPIKVVQRAMWDNPYLGTLDPWWHQHMLPSAPDVRLSSLTRKVNDMRELVSSNLKGQTAEFAAREATAPPPVEHPTTALDHGFEQPAPPATPDIPDRLRATADYAHARAMEQEPEWVRARMEAQGEGAPATAAPEPPHYAEQPPQTVQVRQPDGTFKPETMASPTPEQITSDFAAKDQASRAWLAEHGLLQWEPGELTQAQFERLAEFKAQVEGMNPIYTISKPPTDVNKGFFTYDPSQVYSRASAMMAQRTLLGQWLADTGPLSYAGRFWHDLTSPVMGSIMGHDAKQALLDKFLAFKEDGRTLTTPDAVLSWLRDLNQTASQFSIGSQRISMFRGATGLLKNTINEKAAQAFGAKLMAALRTSGEEPSDLLDQAYNRWYRSMADMARDGGAKGALAAAVNQMYEGFQDTAVGNVNRLVTKTAYHIFRFILDPRWWAMQLAEANMMGALVSGAQGTQLTGAREAELSNAARFHLTGNVSGITPEDVRMREAVNNPAEESGMPFLGTRQNTGFVTRVFDQKRLASAEQVVNSLTTNDPFYKDMVTWLGPNKGTWASQINDMLYQYDAKGVAKAIADGTVGWDPAAIRGAQPLLDRLTSLNQQTFDDVKNMFYGNPNRSELERLGNNYFLYWPLSYQLKATHWLYSALTGGVLGTKSNAAGAALYAHMLDTHYKMMASDPQYAQMLTDHPTLFYLASSLFPLVPGQEGVSLSRPLRGVGGYLGFWPEYQQAKNLDTPQGAVKFAAWLSNLGATYSMQTLLPKLIKELFGSTSTSAYSQPGQ